MGADTLSMSREFSRLIYSELGVAPAWLLNPLPLGDGLAFTTLAGYALVARWDFPPARLAAHWRQAVAEAAKARKVPALAFRQGGADWQVLVPLYSLNAEVFQRWAGLEWAAVLSIPAFCCLIRERMESTP